ncbi:MAG: F0F1 ATP synthase subunit gamma [[Lactobacillus] timonensis]|uniref:F0F1 ATP synthase subunit gamma n=1 Tax=[Lactobacillus] timonensis TaxID=1970790 RepID=UPI000C8330F6|nr:F0F1 ATP synthase subunit gamma [[Lactobacillus] timonensis]MCI1926112.1 F0F1 ATP synthase subunit gamma [[Lactobacillus] timonensis]MCI1957472.1 F0F1 ATP synthase subunit gamma [[Lactobacillus] timonensis]MCI1970519.1 F0F1 ATP synthase subunit gamma [[Lactobacillus] timonensis]MCI2006666.1 F0F1 ATP synthase subunit gamma [[Lactobacillus] timonensis]
MPASLAAVKHKLESTRSTRQITTAMQMVSTSKLNQIQHHTKTYEVYAAKVKSLLVSLVESHYAALAKKNKDNEQGTDVSELSLVNQLFHGRKVQKTGILVVTSDRGLVGSYNSNVIKATLDLMEQHNLTKDNTVFLTIGKTGSEFFKKRGMNVVYEYNGVNDVPQYAEVRKIVTQSVQMYFDGVYDQLYMSYSHYVNRITSSNITKVVLPITKESLGIDEKNKKETNTEFKTSNGTELYPSASELIKVLVPQYCNSSIYGAILDAKTSEHASSANAMRSASDNANDIISTLQLQYNRARQAAITTEITEIVGGMAAQE